MEDKVEHRQRVRKSKSAEQALHSLMTLCSRAERSSFDALRLMRGWGVDENQALQVLEKLQADRYIDDRRYASAFVRDKISFSRWGEYKIVGALRAKGISKEIIDEVMAENMVTQRSSERLEEVLRSKRRQIREDNSYKLKARLVRYGVSAGWPINSVIEAVEKIVEDEI